VPTFAADDGTLLAYREEGSGPPLICHPGGPGRASDYFEDLAGLTAHRTLILLDQRGTGRSAIPEDPRSFNPAQLADDVEALRRSLGLERIELLGHSAGGKVAQVYASAHPERLSALLLITSWLNMGPDTEQERAQIRASRSAEPWYPDAAEAAEAMPYARPAERSRLDRMMRPFWYGKWDERCQAHAASADEQMNLRFAGMFAAAPVPELDLAAVIAPTLVVGGSLDVLTPPSLSRELAGRFSAGKLEILEGAGHFPWVDEPKSFRGAVGGFLDGLGAA
jgi:pimeloyl-ACP methyl ester carboxylesterase